MSWTTTAPVPSLTSRNSIAPRPNPEPSSSDTAPAPAPTTNTPSIGPKPLSLLSSSPITTPRSRTPIAPGKLAKLANALGVSTPNPPSSPSPYPLRSPGTHSLTSFSTSSTSAASTPSRHLLHIIPPVHLPSSSPEDDDDPDYRAQFRRGTLLPVYPTLQSQLIAIAREYALPSTGGMLLYLITDGPGPRITDEAWKMLWLRVLRADRESAGAGMSVGALSISGGSNYSSRSGTPALIANGYPSPASPAESVRKLSRRPSEECESFDSHLLPSPPPSMGAASVSGLRIGDLPAGAFNFTNAGALPILAKVEFDIDKRKAPWYEPWRQRRRQRAESSASAAVHDARRARELVLGHGRRKSGGLEEVKRRLVATTHIPPPPMARMEVEIQQPRPQAAFAVQVGQEDGSEYEYDEDLGSGSPAGYLQLADAEEDEDKLKTSPLTGRALRRESMVPMNFETLVPKEGDTPEESNNEAEDADRTHVSVVNEEEQGEESDFGADAVIMDGERFLREGKDPLGDVFPSDEQTWAQMANDAPPNAYGRPGSEPLIPELLLGGGIVPPSATHERASTSDVSDGDDDNPEDVIALWKAKHGPKIDEQSLTQFIQVPANLDKSLPPSPTEPLLPPQKVITAKHVPPPLVLTPSNASNSPQVIVAPPSAPLEPSSGRSYLAYLDEKKDTDTDSPDSVLAQRQASRPPLPGIEAIEILVNEPSGTVLLQDDDDDDDELGIGGVRSAFTDHSSSEGHEHELSRSRAGSLVGREEFRSRALDELEKNIVAVSPKRWEDDESLQGSMFAAIQITAQTSGTVETPASAETPKALPPTPPKVLPPTPPEMSSDMQKAIQEGDDAKLSKANETVSQIHQQPSNSSTSSPSDGEAPSQVTPLISPIHTKGLPPSPTAEGTSEGEHRAPINSPPREASSPGLELSPDPFGRKLHQLGSEGHEDDVESIDSFPSPNAARGAPPARRSTSSSTASTASTASPPRIDGRRHRVTSRFSQDSNEDDSKGAPRERTNSIISLKSVRNLWRKSGGGPNPTINTVVLRHNGLPLMSPGLNGHTTPPTRFNEEVPPVPSMGFFQHGSGVMASLPPPSKGPEKHHRADSGLDPFHFDQESRYPVRRSPSPVNGYLSDLVPPPASSPVVAVMMPPLTPTTPTMKAKGILKGWATRSKRADSTSTSMSSPIEPSPVTQGKKRPTNIDVSGVVHNVGMPEFAPSPNTAIPRDLVGLGITEKQAPATPLLQSPVGSEPRESTDTTTRLSDFEIVSPATPGRPRRGTNNSRI